ncbi:glycosyltransferase [Sutcliffiella halmapala]
MKHIAFFIPVLTMGGAEKVIISLANGFAAKGYKVDLVLVNKKGSLISTVSSKVHIVDLAAPKTFLSIWKLREYLIHSKPHVFLSALDNANIVASLAVRLSREEICHIISFHTNLKLSLVKPRSFIHGFYPLIMRRLFPRAKGFVAVSQCVAKETGEFLKLPSDIIEVIYNPVIDETLKRKAMEPITHPWLENKEYNTIVAVGRFFEAKDYPTLLYAFTKVQSVLPKTRLIILGDGKSTIKEEMISIIQQEKLEKVVDIRGYEQNPYPYIKKATLFVLTSKWEGFGNVLVEALHLGVPAISTNCKCGPEEILKGGELGRLVAVGDINALASAIIDQFTQLSSHDQSMIDHHLKQMEAGYVLDKYEMFFLKRLEEMKG